MSCYVVGCKSENTPKKYVFCRKHWEMLPNDLRLSLVNNTEKGKGTLRSTPTREWLVKASSYVGNIKMMSVKVDASGKVHRKQEKPEEVKSE